MTGNLNHREPTLETYDIRIARDGSWWHEGARIGRIGLVKLFASVLQRDNDGNFWLVTPAERGRIVVEDAPFVAVEMQVEDTGRKQALRFRSNIDEWAVADTAHPIRFNGGDSHVYVMMRDGLEALLARSVYYDLVALAVEHDGHTGVWSGGEFFRLD